VLLSRPTHINAGCSFTDDCLIEGVRNLAQKDMLVHTATIPLALVFPSTA
jgi:hypothetical protein